MPRKFNAFPAMVTTPPPGRVLLGMYLAPVALPSPEIRNVSPTPFADWLPPSNVKFNWAAGTPKSSSIALEEEISPVWYSGANSITSPVPVAKTRRPSAFAVTEETFCQSEMKFGPGRLMFRIATAALAESSHSRNFHSEFAVSRSVWM